MIELNTAQIFLDSGLRMAESGDLAGAQEALTQAADSGHPEAAPQAANALGWLVADSDPALAESAFKLSIEHGHPFFSSGAAFALGMLYDQHGNLAEALQSFELAVQSPDQETAELARGAVRSLGDTHAARIAAMDPPEAAFTDGCYLRAAGDLAGAVAAFERCMGTGDAEFAPYAGCQLGAIMAAEGEFEKAKSPLRLAVRSGHSFYAPAAAYVLAEILLDEGDRAGGSELLALAVDHPDPGTAGNAAAMLADLRAGGGAR